jgi:uroporphyrinogen decarboxylase
MSATSRELVFETLNFQKPARAPRELWALPIAEKEHPGAINAIVKEFPSDFTGVSGHLREICATKGNSTAIGEYTDEWGCTFHNIQEGVIGEIKDPLVKDWKSDVRKIHVPRELLTIDRDAINRDCAKTDKFISASCCPRPFEQLQFLRGSANFYADLADTPKEMLKFMKEMHGFYCEWLEAWGKTDVDRLGFMDDWGSQRSLLISPKSWREIFKPLYRDYCRIAHSYNKKIFFHSDGHILSVMPDLIEIGVDAVNSQIFCMGVEKLIPFRGKITFWGEIDRQNLLPHGSIKDIRNAVENVHATLWTDGGCIAQCEFGPGAKPENVLEVFKTWDDLTLKKK